MKDTLRRLLNPATTIGTVAGLRDGKVEIATANGRLDAVAPPGIALGDTVKIEHGIVVRVNRNLRCADTYFV